MPDEDEDWLCKQCRKQHSLVWTKHRLFYGTVSHKPNTTQITSYMVNTRSLIKVGRQEPSLLYHTNKFPLFNGKLTIDILYNLLSIAKKFLQVVFPQFARFDSSPLNNYTKSAPKMTEQSNFLNERNFSYDFRFLGNWF